MNDGDWVHAESLKIDYERSLQHAEEMVNYLEESKEYFKTAEEALQESYTIDGKVFDKLRVDTIKKNLDEISSHMQNDIIPTINNNIENLNKFIEQHEPHDSVTL